MHHQRNSILKTLGRKVAVMGLILASTAAAFATLGDGKSAKSNLPGTKTSLLSGQTVLKPGSFSLKSGYNFRGNQVINTAPVKRVIRLNTVATVQKGKTVFIVPLKKNVIFDKVKIDIGNRQFQHH
jgi:hypothetical protein